MLVRTNFEIIFCHSNYLYIKYSFDLLKNLYKIVFYIKMVNLNFIKIQKIEYFDLNSDKTSFSYEDIFWFYTIINSKITNYFKLYLNI